MTVDARRCTAIINAINNTRERTDRLTDRSVASLRYECKQHYPSESNATFFNKAIQCISDVLAAKWGSIFRKLLIPDMHPWKANSGEENVSSLTSVFQLTARWLVDKENANHT